LIWITDGTPPEDGDMVLVLEGLGKSLNSALKKLFGASVIDEELVKELVKDIQRALLMADVDVNLVMKITERVQEQALDENLARGVSRREHIIRVVWDTLAFFLGEKPVPLTINPGKPNLVMMVGIQGSGKTTTIGKLARYYQKRGIKTGVICADNFRPGAYNQLKQLAERSNVPFWGDEEEKDAVKLAKEGFKELEAFIEREAKDPLASAKIFGTREFLTKSATKYYNAPNFFVMRSVAAHMGLYGNSGAEAIYPTFLVDGDGKPLNASDNTYTLTFKKEELPPVKAFWSLTMYDGATQLLVRNPLNRYLLNSAMMDQFEKETDGSIVLYIQKESPGKDKQANWLPAPAGPLYMVLRLYGPEPEALEGKWLPPVLEKVKQQ